jgi:hypothetical protein
MDFGLKIYWILLDWTLSDLDNNRIEDLTKLDTLWTSKLDSPISIGLIAFYYGNLAYKLVSSSSVMLLFCLHCMY